MELWVPSAKVVEAEFQSVEVAVDGNVTAAESRWSAMVADYQSEQAVQAVDPLTASAVSTVSVTPTATAVTAEGQAELSVLTAEVPACPVSSCSIAPESASTDQAVATGRPTTTVLRN